MWYCARKCHSFNRLYTTKLLITNSFETTNQLSEVVGLMASMTLKKYHERCNGAWRQRKQVWMHCMIEERSSRVTTLATSAECDRSIFGL